MLSFSTSPDPQHAELIWRRLAKFCIVYSIGWVVALAYYNVIANVLLYVWPRSTFLFGPNDRYMDLIATWRQAAAPNPYINPGTAALVIYFPLPYAVLRAAGSLQPPTVVLLYFAATFGSLLTIWVWWLRRQWCLWRGDSRWPVVMLLSFAIVVCNYPIFFALDRGNLDPLAMCLMYGAIGLVARRRRVVGGLLLSLASACKGFPFAAVLYWIRRRYLLALAVATGGLAASILGSAATFEGGIRVTLDAFLNNLALFRHQYVVGDMSSHYSSDWLNALRILARWLRVAPFDMALVVQWYEPLATLWAGMLGLLALFVVRDVWRELLAIVLIMLTYPNVANDYKLVMLLPPILEWLISTAGGWRNSVFGVTAALLMLPKHFYFPRGADAASISCIINPVLLLAMSLVLWPTSTEIARLAESFRNVPGRLRALGFWVSRRN